MRRIKSNFLFWTLMAVSIFAFFLIIFADSFYLTLYPDAVPPDSVYYNYIQP